MLVLDMLVINALRPNIFSTETIHWLSLQSIFLQLDVPAKFNGLNRRERHVPY